jgi:hypothetical protein
MIWQPGMNLEQVEQAAIEEAFRFYRGNKTQTSIALGISIRTLDTRLEKYAFDRAAALEAEDMRQRAKEAFARRQRGEAVLDDLDMPPAPAAKPKTPEPVAAQSTMPPAPPRPDPRPAHQPSYRPDPRNVRHAGGRR